MSQQIDQLGALLWGGSHGLSETGASRALRRTGADDYMLELTKRWAASLDPSEVSEVLRRIKDAQDAQDAQAQGDAQGDFVR